MVKSKFSGALFVLSIVFLLSGCSGNDGDNSTEQSRRSPDFGQPDTEADIRGIVESVSGDEITVAKLDDSQREKMRDQKEEEGEEGGGQTSSLGGSPGGSRGMGGFMGGKDEDAQEEKIERMKEMSVGKETIKIPVGIKMLKTEVDKEGDPLAVEATLKDISVDAMVRIWLNQDQGEEKIASFVLIN